MCLEVLQTLTYSSWSSLLRLKISYLCQVLPCITLASHLCAFSAASLLLWEEMPMLTVETYGKMQAIQSLQYLFPFFSLKLFSIIS